MESAMEKDEELRREGRHLHGGEPEWGEDYGKDVDGVGLCECECLEMRVSVW